MKSIKSTRYKYLNSLLKGIRAIKVWYAPCFSCGFNHKLRRDLLFDCPDSDIKAFPYSEQSTAFPYSEQILQKQLKLLPFWKNFGKIFEQ